MTKNVMQLYPTPGEAVPLRGLYLRRERLLSADAAMPAVYANFLTSLDGRIALKNEYQHHFELPAELKSDEDFMLLLELYAHADCIITHGGYMRALAESRLGNILQLPTLAETRYMHEWRQQQAMKPHPDIVIVSGSLDFPWHDSLDSGQQKVHIATGGKAIPECREKWQRRGQQVHQFGESLHVDVNQLMNFLASKGYQSVYLMAGPDLLQDMIKHGLVKHFFLTMSHQLLGGQAFKTLLNGEPLGEAGRLSLKSMYMDMGNSNELGQWYAEFSFA